MTSLAIICCRFAYFLKRFKLPSREQQSQPPGPLQSGSFERAAHLFCLIIAKCPRHYYAHQNHITSNEHSLPKLLYDLVHDHWHEPIIYKPTHGGLIANGARWRRSGPT
jgi:hypothetical protein